MVHGCDGGAFMSSLIERGARGSQVDNVMQLGSRVAEYAPHDDLIKLPLVTVVITNFNYRDYVGEAIRSVLNQTYPNVELVVVDDVSTDDSVQVISDAIRHQPNARLFRRVINGGQGLAMLDGLRASTGDFICFLDSDDVLLPEFCETHVYLHLALQPQVAFTSSDLVNISRSGRVTAGSSGNIRYPFLQAGPEGCTSVPPLRIGGEVGRYYANRPAPDGNMIYLPATKVGYHWASCSGLVFKRAALELIAFEEGIGPVRLSADFYVTLCHLISGSAIYDGKLGGYRIHGKNGYSTETYLDGIDTSRRTPSASYQAILRRFIHMVVNSQLEYFWSLLGKQWLYGQMLACLHEYLRQFNRDGHDISIILAEITQNWPRFSSVVGVDYARWLLMDTLGVSREELQLRGLM